MLIPREASKGRVLGGSRHKAPEKKSPDNVPAADNAGRRCASPVPVIVHPCQLLLGMGCRGPGPGKYATESDETTSQGPNNRGRRSTFTDANKNITHTPGIPGPRKKKGAPVDMAFG